MPKKTKDEAGEKQRKLKPQLRIFLRILCSSHMLMSQVFACSNKVHIPMKELLNCCCSSSSACRCCCCNCLSTCCSCILFVFAARIITKKIGDCLHFTSLSLSLSSSFFLFLTHTFYVYLALILFTVSSIFFPLLFSCVALLLLLLFVLNASRVGH